MRLSFNRYNRYKDKKKHHSANKWRFRKMKLMQDLFVARLAERSDQLRVEVAMGVQRRNEACSAMHEALAQQLAELAQVAPEKLTLLLHKTDSDAIISRSDAELVKQHVVRERKQGVTDQMNKRVKH